MSEAAEWGIPDWRSAAEYGDVGGWSDNRWRWEFTRRRADYRAAFDAASPQTLLDGEMRRFGPMTPPTSPDQPGFTALCADALERYGLADLPNPRIGDQPPGVIAFDRLYQTDFVVIGENDTDALEVERGAAVAAFDLRAPLEPQLDRVRRCLMDAQRARLGKTLPRRRHQSRLWLRYLRVLDGRADGASWGAIARIVLAPENVSCTPKSAEQIHKAALALAFNWAG